MIFHGHCNRVSQIIRQPTRRDIGRLNIKQATALHDTNRRSDPRRGRINAGDLIAAVYGDMCGHSAVDRNHLPGDVARLLRRQENDQVGNVFRSSEVRRQGGAAEAADESSDRWARTASVMINPGTIVFARTPRLPSLVATYIVRVCTPDFDTP